MSMFRRRLMMYQSLNKIPKPIASYRCYDNTNDDEDRDVLRDLTGNGYDIQLYNFAFAESSGYGKYATDFTKWKNYKADYVSKNMFVFTKTTGGATFLMNLESKSITSEIKINVKGFVNSNDYLIYRYYKNGSLTNYKIDSNGIHILPSSDGTNYIGFLSYNIQSEITIEQIPDYKGALVSDGVDDYGLCENFPILTPNKGYTVCAIRKNLQDICGIDQCFISNRKRNQGSDGAFNIEIGFKTNLSNVRTDNFDSTKWLDKSLYPNLFTYQTSKIYNGSTLEIGTSEGSNEFSLFKLGNSSSYSFKGALYALEIYDRDLTDEEIAKVKERMMAEYEAKTGEVKTQFIMEDGSVFLMEDGSKFIME